MNALLHLHTEEDRLNIHHPLHPTVAFCCGAKASAETHVGLQEHIASITAYKHAFVVCDKESTLLNSLPTFLSVFFSTSLSAQAQSTDKPQSVSLQHMSSHGTLAYVGKSACNVNRGWAHSVQTNGPLDSSLMLQKEWDTAPRTPSWALGPVAPGIPDAPSPAIPKEHCQFTLHPGRAFSILLSVRHHYHYCCSPVSLFHWSDLQSVGVIWECLSAACLSLRS